jgi:hypothetical protein
MLHEKRESFLKTAEQHEIKEKTDGQAARCKTFVISKG